MGGSWAAGLAALALLVVTVPASAAEVQSAVQALHEAREQVAAGNLDGALDFVDRGLALDPGYPPLWKQKARVHQLRGEDAEALKAAQRYLVVQPDDVEARAVELHSLIRLDQGDAFEESLRKGPALGSLPDATGTSLVLAVLRKPDESDWLRRLGALLERWPGQSQEIRALVGALQLAVAGKESAARAELAKFQPETEEGHRLALEIALTLGDRRAAAGEWLAAISAYELALQWDPGSVAARRELGWAYRRTGKPAEAAEQWQTAWQAAPDPLRWLHWIAAARLDARQWDLARPILQEILQRDPEDARSQARYLFVLTLLRSEPDRAELESRLQRTNPKALALGNALLLKQRKLYDRAIRLLEQQGFAADFREEVRELRQLLAQRLILERNWDAAEVPLQALLKDKDADRVLVLRDLGWLYWGKGERERALRTWEQAIQLGAAKDGRFVFEVSERLLESGATENAIAFYDKWSGSKTLFPLGVSLVRAGKASIASPVFDEALRRNDETYYGRLYLALALIAESRYERAGELLDQWIEASPAVPPTVRTQVFRPGARQPEPLAIGPDEAFLLVDQVVLTIFERKATTLLGFVDKVDTKWGKAPFFRTRIAEYEDRAGAALFDAGKWELAQAYLERTLRRDPDNREAWLRLAYVQRRAGLTEESERSLRKASESRDRPTLAVQERIRGELALLDGQGQLAATRWLRSLQIEPSQHDLRSRLIDLLVTLHEYERARGVLAWYEREVERGRVELRDRVAIHRAALGDLEGALAIWAELSRENPRNTGFALEHSRALFRLCRSEEALAALQPLFAETKKENLGQLLAEIGFALDQPGQVLEWADLGLSVTPASRPLLRAKAEAAERLGRPDTAEEAARAYLQIDPDSVPMQTTLAWALAAQGKLDESSELYRKLLERNPEFTESLLRLRELSQRAGETGHALDHAEALARQRPGDPGARTRLAISLAERQKFARSYEILAAIAFRATAEAVPVLAFDAVSACEYPGVVSLERWKQHVRRLRDEGYAFVDTAELLERRKRDTEDAQEERAAEEPSPRAVMIVVSRTSPAVLREIDQVLAEVNGKAVLVVGEESLATGTPLLPDRGALRDLEKTDRWRFALSDYSAEEVVIDENGHKAGRWTHARWLPSGKAETADETTARIREDLGRLLARTDFLAERPATWFYPSGDYGQMSLDTRPEVTAAAATAVRESFAAAFTTDEDGFAVAFSDPVRMPYRPVPADWDAEALARHLRQRNPFHYSVLELAKVAAWHRQHERANQLFATAESLGADPKELEFHWASNAYFQGDLPVALEHYRAASELDPDSTRVESALDRALWQKRPLAEPTLLYWEDNEDRTYWSGAIRGGLHVADALELHGLYGRTRWERDGRGDEEANLYGGGGRWYLFPEYWVDGEGWAEDFEGDEIDTDWGFLASLRGPIRLLPLWNLNGFYQIEGAREEIDTVETVRARNRNHRISLYTYERVADFWDVFLNGHRDDRDDGNETLRADGRILRRLLERPYVGFGYSFRVGDSDFDPPEYYAPEELQQHQGYANLRDEWAAGFGYSLSAAAGSARERERDWRFVWTARGELRWQPGKRFYVSLNASHFESSSYEQTRAWGSIGLRF